MPQPNKKVIPHRGKIGAPSTLTPEVHKAICDCVREGNYPETGAYLAGIPRPTMISWLRTGELAREATEKGKPTTAHEDACAAFLTDLNRAMAEAEKTDVAAIGAAAADDWKAAAFRLERRNRGNWGRVERVEIDGNVTTVNVEPTEKVRARMLDRVKATLAKKDGEEK